MVEPVAIVATPVEIVPVVESASSPKVIASVDEEIDPSAKVRLPTLAPVPVIAVKVPAAGVAPPIILFSIVLPEIEPFDIVKSSAT